MTALISVGLSSCNKSVPKYTICWQEKTNDSVHSGWGHCRQDFVLTGSGYTVTDTIYTGWEEFGGHYDTIITKTLVRIIKQK